MYWKTHETGILSRPDAKTSFGKAEVLIGLDI